MIADYVTISLLLVTLIAGIGSIIYLFTRQAQKGARLFTFYQIVSLGVLITIIGSALSGNNDEVFFWMRMRAPFQIYSVVLYLLFTLDYVGLQQWLRPRRVILLMIIPTVLSLLSLHPATVHLVVGKATSVHNAFLMYEVSFEKSAGYWIALVYAYTALMLSMVLFLRHTLISAPPRRWQSLILFLVSFFTLVFHFLNLLPFIPDTAPNTIVYGLLIRSTIITWALFAYRLFDLMPIALQSVFDHIPVGIIVLDRKGNIVEINPITLQELRRSHQSTIGKPIAEVIPALGRFIDLVPLDKEYVEEVESDGAEKRYYEVYQVPLYDKRHHMAGRLITVREITQRKLGEIEREALIQTLDSYAHTVAHNLKNPIGIVLGYATILRDDGQNLLPEQVNQLNTIINATQRNVRIIDELLLYASIRSDSRIPKLPVNVGLTLHNARIRTEEFCISLRIDAQIHIVTEIPDAMGYEQWVEEIWVNYFSNAVKYGGNPPRIEVGATPEGDHVRYWVRDNGAGLSVEDQAALFRKGERLNQHTRIQGHGLGLTICAHIAERLGGSVGVNSEVGKGSTFWFTLPAVISGMTRYNRPNIDLRAD